MLCLGQNRLNYLGRLSFGKPAFARIVPALVVIARDDLLTRGLHTGQKWRRRVELAKRLRAGAASCANRDAAYFECRIVISSKSSTPQRFRF